MQDLKSIKNIIDKYKKEVPANDNVDNALKDKASLQAVANSVIASSLMKGSK